MRDINSMSKEMPWPKTGATQYHAQLGLPDNGRAIKGLIICHSWDIIIEPWDLAKRSGPRLFSTVPRVRYIFL